MAMRLRGNRYQVYRTKYNPETKKTDQEVLGTFPEHENDMVGLNFVDQLTTTEVDELKAHFDQVRAKEEQDRVRYASGVAISSLERMKDHYRPSMDKDIDALKKSLTDLLEVRRAWRKKNRRYPKSEHSE